MTKLEKHLQLDNGIMGKELRLKDGSYMGEITGYGYNDNGLYLDLSICESINWKDFDKYDVVEPKNSK